MLKKFLVALLWVPTLALASITTTTNRIGPVTIAGLPQSIATFPFVSSADLAVYDLGTAGTPRVPFVLLTLGSDYTVTGGGYNGANQMQTGSISVLSTGTHAVITGDQIVIIRAVTANQTTSLQSSGALTIQNIEQMGDKQATLAQQLTELSARAFQFDPGETFSGVLPPPTTRANTLLGFTSTGNITLIPQTAAPATGALLNTVSSIAALRAYTPVTSLATGQSIIVTGYYAANDGGGGTYVWNSTSTTADNGGTVIQATGVTTGRWLLKYSGAINAKWFGAKGDGVSNDTSAIANACAAVPDGGTVFFPAGTYAITTIPLTKGISLRGAGMFTSTIKRIAGSTAVQNDLFFIQGSEGSNVSGVEVRELGFDQAWTSGAGSVYSCITIYFAEEITIRDCYFTRGQYHGVKINVSNHVTIEGCRFYQNYYDGVGIGGWSSNNTSITSRTKNVRIANNSFEDMYAGPICQVGVDNVLIHGNQLLKSSIQFGQDCNHVVITDNKIDGVNSYGFVYSVFQIGIYVEANTDVIISNNEVLNITTGPGNHYAIWVTGSELQIGVGPVVQMPAYRTIVQGNEVYNVTDIGIYATCGSFDGSLLGNNVTIQSNQIMSAGAGLVVTKLDKGLVSKNMIYGTQLSGVLLSAATHIIVSENQIFNPSLVLSNSYYGIDIQAGCAELWITRNNIVDNQASQTMRFGVFDEVGNAGGNAKIRSFGNIIAGTITNIPWYPLPAIPTTGQWRRGDTIQTFHDQQGGPSYYMCILDNTIPGYWQAAGGQNGFPDTGGGSPSGVITPVSLNELCFDSVNKDWWISTGLTNTDWKKVTP